MSLDLCDGYYRVQVLELFAGRARLSAEDIAALDLPQEHRIWALVALLPERGRRLWACDVAEGAWLAHGVPVLPDDRRPFEAIRVARLSADGKATPVEVKSALAAARAVARTAARGRATVCWTAAGVIARDAAWTAAGAIALAVSGIAAHAALAAAGCVGGATARHDEMEAQLASLIEAHMEAT